MHPRNPRYFTDGSGRVVYLTGSHNWYNLQDSAEIGRPLKAFDYDGYLRLLKSWNHNFMRMWAWEGGVNRRYCEPLPYPRTGPGTALDGKPKFDLTKFDQRYFDRLRKRVLEAARRGIYVSVMLFQGWSIYDHDYGNPWPLHPFNAANNINGVNGDPDGDGQGREVHALRNPAVTRLQEAYVRKVIDTVNDLDNVLYEITNETAIFSKDWQYHMVRYIKNYEAAKPKQHPVGMTAFDSGREGSMEALLAGPADWISPQNDGISGDYTDDPPAADGRKVIISDTDHLWGEGGSAQWVWKSFLRGHNPIYMDRFALLTGDPKGDIPGAEEVRRAMGHTRTVASRINLAEMTPHNELASSTYCLAQPGREYLAYLPQGGHVKVDLSAVRGTISAQWFNCRDGKFGKPFRVDGGAWREFASPDGNDWVLYLKAR